MKEDIIVKGIIFNRKLNKILLVQRCEADEVGPNTWENAGGNIEAGETPEAAIRREIQEETGIAEVKIERVGYVTLVNSEKPYLIIAYLCDAVTDVVTLSKEHQAYIWADREACMNMLPKAIIDDFVQNSIFEYIGIA